MKIFWSKSALTKMQAVAIALIIIVPVIAATAYYVWLQPAPTLGDTLTIATASPLKSLDPHAYKSTVDIYHTAQIYDPLIRFDSELILQPHLVTSWEIVDNTTWRFHLRTDVKFHDSSEFNATVVKYNFDRLETIPGLTSATYVKIIESVEVEDEYTVIIKTSAPTRILLNILAMDTCAMVSSTAIEKYGQDYLSTNPVGTGPYKFVEWKTAEYLKLERNEDYFLEPSKTKYIIFKDIPEESVRYQAFVAGEIDIIGNIPPDKVAELETDPDVNVIKTANSRFMGLYMVPGRHPFDDVKVRKAIAYAIDRESIVKYILMNLGQVATFPVHPLLLGSIPEEEYGPGEPYKYNVTKAKELLTEAGWVDTDGDGIVDKDGQPLKFKMHTSSGRYLRDTQLAEAVAGYLDDVGIDCEVGILEWVKLVSDRAEGQVDLLQIGYILRGDLEPVIRILLAFTKPEDYPRVWELLEEQYQCLDEEERGELIQEFQREYIVEQCAFIPIYYCLNLYATTKNVHDFATSPLEQFYLKTVWVEP